VVRFVREARDERRATTGCAGQRGSWSAFRTAGGRGTRSGRRVMSFLRRDAGRLIVCFAEELETPGEGSGGGAGFVTRSAGKPGWGPTRIRGPRFGPRVSVARLSWVSIEPI